MIRKQKNWNLNIKWTLGSILSIDYFSKRYLLLFIPQFSSHVDVKYNRCVIWKKSTFHVNKFFYVWENVASETNSPTTPNRIQTKKIKFCVAKYYRKDLNSTKNGRTNGPKRGISYRRPWAKSTDLYWQRNLHVIILVSYSPIVIKSERKKAKLSGIAPWRYHWRYGGLCDRHAIN